MKQYHTALSIAVLFLSPLIAHADVRITEVAWMGVSGVNGQYGEWLELYNNGTAAVNMAGWQIAKDGGAKPVFTLTKYIPAGGYVLVERTTASMPDPVPGINDESGSFSNSGLANTGEHLVLKDTTGSIVDTLNFTGGWPAGDATSKQTMQWHDGAWVTADATPKAASSGGTESNSGGTGGSGNGGYDEKESLAHMYTIPKVSPNKPRVEFLFPSNVYSGMVHDFVATAVLEYNYRPNEGVFDWNMGDGTVIHQTTLAPVPHSYRYPGTYTVSFSYRPTIDRSIPPTRIVDTISVNVAAPTVSVASVDAGAGLEVKNMISTPIDISGWRLSVASGSITIPDMTIIAPKATIVFPAGSLGLSSIIHPTISTPTGVPAASVPAATVAMTRARAGYTTATAEPYAPLLLASAVDATAQTPDASVGIAKDAVSDVVPKNNNTKQIMLGVAALFVIGFCILLERLMARQE